MFVSLVGMMALASASVSVPCETAGSANGQILDVCEVHSWDNQVVAAVTMQASLTPQPASQQIMLFRYEGKWMLRLAGFRWPSGPLFETRRNEFAISDEEAQALLALMSETKLNELAARPYYGDGDAICTDGARYELALAKDGQKWEAARHSCADRADFKAITREFRLLALKYDKDAEGMLTAFR